MTQLVLMNNMTHTHEHSDDKCTNWVSLRRVMVICILLKI